LELRPLVPASPTLSPAFLQPRSLDEAVGLLQHYGDEAMVVAGATAVTIMLQQRLIAPRALVSIGQLPGLRRIEIVNGSLWLGALTTHREVELSSLVRQQIPVLAEAFGRVANVRVRNVATIGGVLAEADYASDPPAVLLALDAEVEILGPRGSRILPIDQFFRGFYETALEPTELVTAVRVPLLPDGTRAVYERFVTRSSEDRPCLAVTAVVRLGADGRTCAELRVAVGAASETPQRFPEIEALARGRQLEADLLQRVADRYAESIDTLADLRGSAWYRSEMIRVWVRRAVERARGQAVAGAV
jgi:carbon-monoxide dehydrogenase medium subunit